MNWTYRTADGEVLAEVWRDDIPPIGYRIRIAGNGGPVRHYKVAKVNSSVRDLILEPDAG